MMENMRSGTPLLANIKRFKALKKQGEEVGSIPSPGQLRLFALQISKLANETTNVSVDWGIGMGTLFANATASQSEARMNEIAAQRSADRKGGLSRRTICVLSLCSSAGIRSEGQIDWGRTGAVITANTNLADIN